MHPISTINESNYVSLVKKLIQNVSFDDPKWCIFTTSNPVDLMDKITLKLEQELKIEKNQTLFKLDHKGAYDFKHMPVLNLKDHQSIKPCFIYADAIRDVEKLQKCVELCKHNHVFSIMHLIEAGSYKIRCMDMGIESMLQGQAFSSLPIEVFGLEKE